MFYLPPIPGTPPLNRSPGTRAGWQSLRAGPSLWHGEAGFLGELDSGRMPIEEWIGCGRATIVKTGPHRTIYRLIAGSGALFVKRYRVTGWGGRLQQFLRRTAAERECRSIVSVAAAEIPTAVPVACGVSFSGPWISDSWLVLKEIEQVVPLDVLVQQCEAGPFGPIQSPGVRQKLTSAVGNLLGRFHAAGFVHHDLHAGNILVRIENEQPLVWLIDLHQVRPSASGFSLRMLAKNLALFDHFFLERTSSSDRSRFLRAWRSAYLAALQEPLDLPARDWTEQVAAACREAEPVAFRKRDRKWRRGNRRLIVADTETVRCRGLAEIGRELLDQFREDPAAARTELGRFFGTLELRQVEEPAAARGRFWNRNEDGVAARTWEMGHALIRRGVPALRPIAFAEERGPSVVLGVVAFEHLAGAETLTHHIRKSHSLFAESPGDRSAPWLRPLARAVKKLHDRSALHEGLSTDAVRVTVTPRANGRGHQAAVAFDSLESVRIVRTVRFSQQVRQLAKLAESVLRLRPMRCTEALRFLQTYLGAKQSADWKVWWSRIRQAVASIRSLPASDASSIDLTEPRPQRFPQRRAG